MTADQRQQDERQLMDVLMSKQPTVPQLADMLNEARGQGWDHGYQQACDDIHWVRPSDTRKITPNPYREEKP